MRILFVAALIALIAGPVAAADAWSTFRDPGAAFTVDMPGTPTVSPDSTKTADGRDVPILSYIIDRGTSAMVADFTALTVDPGKAIDGGVSAIASSGKAIQSNVIDQLDGQVGRSITFVDAQNNQYTDRVFFFNGRLYQVLTVLPPNGEAAAKDAAMRFSASFHFSVK